jgi:glycosyltransferase involved in cell wall biosynthesis
MDRDKLGCSVSLEDKENAYDYTQLSLDLIHRKDPIDAVYERLSLWSCGASRWCRNHKIPHWVEVNAPLVREATIHRDLNNADKATQVELEVLRHATMLFPVSPWLGRWLVSQGCDHDKIYHLPNGVNENWLAKSHPLPPVKGWINIGFIGSLRPWHDLTTVVNAIKILPPIRFSLTVVGDGPSRVWLNEQIKDPRLSDRIVWMGAVPYPDIPSAIDAMDICIAPYENADDFYFCPIKILEYGARRRPVVAADIYALREQFPKGTIEFYSPGDAKQLARSLVSLVENEPWRQGLADRLYDFASEHTWKNHAEQVLIRGGFSSGIETLIT